MTDSMFLALDGRVTIALTVFGVLILLGGLLYLSARGELRGRRTSRIPAAMRPAPDDDALERRVLERYLLVGAAATLLMALWLPGYWLREPTRLQNAADKFLRQEIVEGEDLYVSLCASCHGEMADQTIAGLPRQVSLDGQQLQTSEPPLKFAYARYKAAGRSNEEIRQILYDAISKGRPGTVMPTWLLAFGGSLNSAQVENVILYIESVQEEFPEIDANLTGQELFDANCAICHGPNGDGTGGVGPNLQVALQRLTLDEVHTTISQGRLNTNRYSMPAWAALGEDAIAKLVDFISNIQEG